jgi:phosphate transport system substrate-binding protein
MKRYPASLAAILPALFLLAGCPAPKEDKTAANGTTTPQETQEAPTSTLSGAVNIDGSSTVYPITEAIAEEFMAVNPSVNVTVGISGTGGGFKRFGAGETDISDASRAIKQEEADKVAAAGMQYVEIPVAFDALTIVVNPQNDWCTDITTDELKKLWDQGSTVAKWSEIRAGWPDSPIKLYGPGTDSGTFDYFTEAINGKSKQCRTDFTASEDDNVLVTGVAGDKFALGYFGLAYFEENKDKIKAVPVDSGGGGVEPNLANVMNGTYTPLSRPLFIYISDKAYARPEVTAFVDYYLEHAAQRSEEVGYIPLPASAYATIKGRWEARTPGSLFLGKETAGMAIDDILALEGAAAGAEAAHGGGAAAEGGGAAGQ